MQTIFERIGKEDGGKILELYVSKDIHMVPPETLVQAVAKVETFHLTLDRWYATDQDLEVIMRMVAERNSSTLKRIYLYIISRCYGFEKQYLQYKIDKISEKDPDSVIVIRAIED